MKGLLCFLVSALASSDIVLQSGHGANISALAFSPDGHFLVTASEDSTVKMWDPFSGVEIRTLRGHSNLVSALAISSDGARIASASLDHTLRVWVAATGETEAVIRGPQPTVYLLKITPDGSSLVTAETVAAGSIVRIWDIKSGKQLQTIKRNEAAVSHLFFSGSNTMFVAEESGEDDTTGALTSYDLRTGRLQQTRREILCGVSDDGRWIAVDRSTQKARKAMIVDLPHDKPVATLSGQVSQVVFSAAGDWLAYESDAGDTAVVRRLDGGAAHSIHGRSAEFSMLALSPDGRWLASTGADFSVHIWDVETGKLAHGIAGQYTPTAVAFNPDGRRLAVNGGSTDLGSAVQMWDIERRAQSAAPRVKHAVTGLAFSKDGTYLAASGTGVEIFETRNNGLSAKVDCSSSGQAVSPAFSPNGRSIAANCGGIVTIWSIAGEREIAHFGEASDNNNGPMAFSPDGRYLAAASTNGFLVYDSAAGKVIQRAVAPYPVAALVFSPNSEQLLCGLRLTAAPSDAQQTPPTLFLVEVHTRRRLWTSSAGQWVSALKFIKDGHAFLAAAGDDLHKAGTMNMYDAGTGKLIKKLSSTVPNSVVPAISPNGEWVSFGWNSATVLRRLSY